VNEATVVKVEPIEGEVFAVRPCWFRVKLEGVKEEFALHSNWFAEHGTLKLGDKVRYVVSKRKWYGSGDLLLFEKLRKVEEEERELEVEVEL